MKANRKISRIPVEWTDVAIHVVPVLGPGMNLRVAGEATDFYGILRGNYSRVTRFAATTPRRMFQVLG